VVTPAGGLACHVDAMRFIDHVPQSEYPAARCRRDVHRFRRARHGARLGFNGSDAQGNDVPADMELLRMAVPRRVYTMSHCQYVADRLDWLYATELVGASRSTRSRRAAFLRGLMKPTKSNWGAALLEAFEKGLGTEC